MTGPSNIFRFLDAVWEIRALDLSFSANLRFFTEKSPESRSAALRLTVDVPFAAALCLSVACSFFQLLERAGASIARRDQVGNPFLHAMAEMNEAARSIGGLVFFCRQKGSPTDHTAGGKSGTHASPEMALHKRKVPERN